jgi:hypothetical protein
MLYESLLQHESDNPLQKCHDKDHDVPMAQQMGFSDESQESSGFVNKSAW